MTRRSALLLAGIASFAMPSLASAQSDVVVMRRVVAKPTRSPNTATPTPTPTPTPIGTPTPTPTPTPTSTGFYNWTVGTWTTVGNPACGGQEEQTRTVTCEQTGAGIVDDALCTGNGSGPRPVTNQTIDAPACTYQWTVGSWSAPRSTCGASVETRSVTCQDGSGRAADVGSCISPKPDSTQTVDVVDGCTTEWTAGDWGATVPACGPTVQYRTVNCIRSDGTTVDESLCSGTRPEGSRPEVDYSTCSDGRTNAQPYNWTVGDYGAPSSTCGAATETRSVQCLDESGATVADSMCAGGRPDGTKTSSETSGCTFHWQAGAFGPVQPACGPSVETRSVSCMRSDGTPADDAACTDARPATTTAVNDYSACSDGRTNAQPYNWTIGGYGAPSATCGAATETRSVQCLDDGGATVTDSMCVGAKPATTTTSSETSGCTYQWQTGPFGAPQQACGPTIQTRSVICQRSDATTAADALCTDAKPSATQPATDYGSCTFGWATTAYSAPSNTCGNAVETRTVTCQRSDGTNVDDAQCTGSKPPASQTSYETSGCGVSWQQGAWAVSAACGATTETRTVTCQRSDGQTVDDSQCAPVGTKPPTSQATTDYSTCTFAWAATAYTGSTTTCGTYTQTRTVTCQRSDGTTAASASSCTGTMPPSSQTITDTSGCTYSWYPEAYGAATPACGATTQTRVIDCKRSDGTILPGSACSGVPNQPTATQATTDYSQCTYAWNASAWKGTAGCGSTVTQTRTVTCGRSDGTDVTSANASANYPYCSKSSMPPSSQPITDYSQCSYSWQETYGTWSGTCSSTATRTNTVKCVRSDGVTMTDQTLCNASTKPATTDTGNYSSCTYTPAYGAYGSCSNYIQTAPITSCTRSDGTVVDNSLCGANSQSISKSCSTTGTQCGAMITSASAYNTGSTNPSSRLVGNTKDSNTALAYCYQYIAGRTLPGVCAWNLNTSDVTYITGPGITFRNGTGGTVFTSANCGVSGP